MTVSVTINIAQMLEDWHVECRLYESSGPRSRTLVAAQHQVLPMWPEDWQDDPLTAVLRTLQRYAQLANEPSPIA